MSSEITNAANDYQLSGAFKGLIAQFLEGKKGGDIRHVSEIPDAMEANYKPLSQRSIIDIASLKKLKGKVLRDVFAGNNLRPFAQDSDPVAEDDWQVIEAVLNHIGASEDGVATVRQAFEHDLAINRGAQNLSVEPTCDEWLHAIQKSLDKVLKRKRMTVSLFVGNVKNSGKVNEPLERGLDFLNACFPSDKPDANLDAMWALGEELHFTLDEQNKLHDQLAFAETARKREHGEIPAEEMEAGSVEIDKTRRRKI